MTLKRGTRVAIKARNHWVDGCEGIVLGPGEGGDTIRVSVVKTREEIVPCHTAWLTEIPGIEPNGATPPIAAEAMRDELHRLLLAYTFSTQPNYWELFQKFDAANKQIVLDAYAGPIQELITQIMDVAKKHA